MWRSAMAQGHAVHACSLARCLLSRFSQAGVNDQKRVDCCQTSNRSVSFSVVRDRNPPIRCRPSHATPS